MCWTKYVRRETPFFYAPLDRKFPPIAVRDIGLAGARVLQESWTGGRVLEVNVLEGGTDFVSSTVS